MDDTDPGSKPFFDLARGEAEATLLAVPPFSFPGVTARVFPLRASMDILHSFCKGYLNVAPPEICRFQPYLPYVFLVVLDYGRGAIETANLGWVSQHEIFFAVPLERWHRYKTRMIFDEWLLNTPFIFVDSATSLNTGRVVYGWPKVLVSLRPRLDQWLTDPRDPSELLSLRLEGFGSGAKKTPLLKIHQELDQNPSLAFTDLSAVNPFKNLSSLTRGLWSAWADLISLFLRSPLAGFGPQQGRLESGSGFLLESLRQLSDFFQEPQLNVVTLKQFRDAACPDEISYQALVKSGLAVDRVNGGGPLGLYNLLQGDASGGFRIRLYDNPSLPIADSLGLRAVRQHTDGGVKVSILEPMFPFWLSVDLTYGAGQNLGWRMRDSPWYGLEGEVARPAESSSSYSYSLNYSYNTVAGAAQQEWIGPYIVPKASCEVYPLRVYDTEQLDRFIQQYLNQSEQHQFERWGNYVYMVVSRSRTFSQGRSAVSREIAFYLPLHWREQDKDNGYVVAKPYAFIDDPIFAMTMREVQGVPAIDATIETPEQSWLRQGPVLRMKTDVFTVLDAGMGVQRRTLLEVMAPEPLQRRNIRPLSDSEREGFQELFASPKEVRMLTLKQFRDARDPDRACYQALVLEPWKVFLKPPQRLGPGMRIYVYNYPSLPLAHTLGLVDPRKPAAQSPRKKKRVVADVLTPEDPFRVELNINLGLAQVLSHTAGNLPWTPRNQAPSKPSETPEWWLALLEALNQTLGVGPQALIEYYVSLGEDLASDSGGGTGGGGANGGSGGGGAL